MAAERVRIYDLAKKLGLSNKEVIVALQKNMGIEVKSHSSTITPEQANKIEKILTGKEEKTSAVAAQDSKPAAAPKPPVQRFEYRGTPSGLKKYFKPEPVKQPEPPKPEPPKQPEVAKQTPPVAPPEVEPKPTQPGQKSPESGRTIVQAATAAKPGSIPRIEFTKPQQSQKPQQPQAEQQRTETYRPKDRPPFEKRFDKRPADGRPQGESRPHGAAPARSEDKRFTQDRTERRPESPRRFEGDSRPFRKPELFAQPPAAPLEEGKAKPSRREEPKKKDKYRSKEELEQERIEERKLQAKLAEKKKREEQELAELEALIKEVSIETPLTVGELAAKLRVSIAAVIKELMMKGVLATVNQTIDVEIARKTAEALGYTIIKPSEEPAKAEMEAKREKISAKNLEGEEGLIEKPPVVTIMGHVDHGKTTLLDAIRKSKHKIVSTEAGGITQSIGAYTAEINDKKIVFIDTPGHSAFTAMRARGAQLTDIVILVVAADDGIMPQTIEAINHAKAAKVPIIVAVNKIDKEGANPDRVLQQLTEYGLVSEKWGGDTITVEVSALQGINLDELLEYILLVSEIEQLKANPNRLAAGVVIESKLDKGKGAVATFLVQAGTLHVSDYVVVGAVGGRIRALIDDHGERIQKAGPGTPVEVLGLSDVPEAGEFFEAVESDKAMKEILDKRTEEERKSRLEAIAPLRVKRETLAKKVEGEEKELNIIIKANTHGSAEAVSASLQQLESKKIFVKIIHLGVGEISEADVMLASASDAIIIGFAVKEDANALRLAAEEGVVIRKYDIIYKMLEDVEQTMLGLLEPEYNEVVSGTAEVRQVFTVGKNVRIAGCYVLDGKIMRNKDAIVERNGKEIFRGQLSQLKRFKDDVKEVAGGYECGISFDKFNDIEEGDIIKVLTKEEIKRHSLI
ncbi:MAG: translation initiation factor IF-2 [Candidatus Gastranaerophilales bacterium]|nr:translation initiation factor IF-2 [Candidatus Gastranaerophilales bacterium]